MRRKLLILDFSNEVQNFLYLSRDFDTSRIGEGMNDSKPR